MGKLTSKVFNESCCDGGECGTNDLSAKPCGCDVGAKWVCQRHQEEGHYFCPACGEVLPAHTPDCAAVIDLIQ